MLRALEVIATTAGWVSLRSARIPQFRLEEDKILVPLDYSPGSRKALADALPVANQCQAGLLLLQVVELYSIDYLFGSDFRAVAGCGCKASPLEKTSFPILNRLTLEPIPLTTLGKSQPSTRGNVR